MNIENLLTYLETWIEINAQEVYDSPREYINIHELRTQLRTLKRVTGDN